MPFTLRQHAITRFYDAYAAISHIDIFAARHMRQSIII